MYKSCRCFFFFHFSWLCKETWTRRTCNYLIHAFRNADLCSNWIAFSFVLLQRSQCFIWYSQHRRSYWLCLDNDSGVLQCSNFLYHLCWNILQGMEKNTLRQFSLITPYFPFQFLHNWAPYIQSRRLPATDDYEMTNL